MCEETKKTKKILASADFKPAKGVTFGRRKKYWLPEWSSPEEMDCYRHLTVYQYMHTEGNHWGIAMINLTNGPLHAKTAVIVHLGTSLCSGSGAKQEMVEDEWDLLGGTWKQMVSETRNIEMTCLDTEKHICGSKRHVHEIGSVIISFSEVRAIALACGSGGVCQSFVERFVDKLIVFSEKDDRRLMGGVNSKRKIDEKFYKDEDFELGDPSGWPCLIGPNDPAWRRQDPWRENKLVKMPVWRTATDAWMTPVCGGWNWIGRAITYASVREFSKKLKYKILKVVNDPCDDGRITYWYYRCW